MNEQPRDGSTANQLMANQHLLTELTSGQRARIQGLDGGYGLRSRLAALGFTPGAEITVLQNFGFGPMLVTVRGTRIALGRGEARKILIRLD